MLTSVNDNRFAPPKTAETASAEREITPFEWCKTPVVAGLRLGAFFGAARGLVSSGNRDRFPRQSIGSFVVAIHDVDFWGRVRVLGCAERSPCRARRHAHARFILAKRSAICKLCHYAAASICRSLYRDRVLGAGSHYSNDNDHYRDLVVLRHVDGSVSVSKGAIAGPCHVCEQSRAPTGRRT
ncbi:hypothetical protein Enr8_49790 [Blastopirellula retiformator]|uniref:Uncharacterized protein n=1 Tax=Blastopirellula retiformator TaxID=2527970 RepID=A0A5C5UV66_9BACT|nr:hypothetical protein Enr8_49790 [Blastopirellula retiformator]